MEAAKSIETKEKFQVNLSMVNDRQGLYIYTMALLDIIIKEAEETRWEYEIDDDFITPLYLVKMLLENINPGNEPKPKVKMELEFLGIDEEDDVITQADGLLYMISQVVWRLYKKRGFHCSLPDSLHLLQMLLHNFQDKKGERGKPLDLVEGKGSKVS